MAEAVDYTVEPLSETELEQAMVLNMFEKQDLYALFYLSIVASRLPDLIFFYESAGGKHRVSHVLTECSTTGEKFYQTHLDNLENLLCNEWQFCKRRATAGFGNTRILISALFQFATSILQKEGGDYISRDSQILFVVLLARADLSALCKCSERN